MLNYFDDLGSFGANGLDKCQGRARLYLVLVIELVQHLRFRILNECDHPNADSARAMNDRLEQRNVPYLLVRAYAANISVPCFELRLKISCLLDCI